MPHPWDRYLDSKPEPTAVNRLYLGMLAAGLKPVSVEDFGKAGRTMGSRTIFACGCERIFRVRLAAPAVETEHLRRCETHRNLLTEGPDWAHDDEVESKARQQQENPDGRHDDPDDH